MKSSKYLLVLTAAVLEVCSCSGVPAVQLNDGRQMPGFGFGTWLGFKKDGELEAVQDDSVQQAVQAALDAGYRHLDTAAVYSTEDQVGRAVNKKISDGVVTREELFITSKLWNDRHARSEVVPALRESLSKLNLEYLDLYLIHWPMAQFPNMTDQDIDYVETWQGMVDARNLNLTRSIGVSNFNQEMLDRLIKETGVTPAVLQVEVNLNLQQHELRRYCRRRGVAVVGYSPFGSLFGSRAAPAPPPRGDDPSLLAIAQTHNKTVPQIVLRYLVELGVTPIPKTVNKSRVVENFDIFDFQLTEEEKKTLGAFDKHFRVIDVPFWKNSRYYPFEKN